MKKNKGRIIVFILSFIFIFLSFYLYKQHFRIQATTEDRGIINFNIHGEDENIPEFKIVINKSKKIINVIDRRSEKYLDKALGNKKYFSIEIYDRNDKKKYSATLLGNEKGSSSKLNGLDNFTYEYGDYLKFFIDDYENMKLSGDIKGLRPFYLRVDDLKFNLTQEGIKVQDTSTGVAYNIQFNNTISIKKGEPFDPLKDIIVTNEYDEDYMSNVRVRGAVNTNVPGKYVIEYVVVDRGYVSVPMERTIIVVEESPKEKRTRFKNIKGIYDDLKIKNHRNYFRSIDRKINKFIIKFKDEGNEHKHGQRRIKRD